MYVVHMSMIIPEVLASTLKAPKAQGFESAMEIGLLLWYQVEQWQPSRQNPWENFWIQPRKPAALCKPSQLGWDVSSAPVFQFFLTCKAQG